MRAAQIKRCLLITCMAVEGTDKEQVLVNLHLEVFDDGEGKFAQTKLLMEVLQQEHAKGNYVIADGDFNQTFTGGLKLYSDSKSDKQLRKMRRKSCLIPRIPIAWSLLAPAGPWISSRRKLPTTLVYHTHYIF